MTNFQQRCLTELRAFFLPVVVARFNTHGRALLFEQLGFTNPDADLPMQDIQVLLEQVSAAVDVIESLIQNPPESLEEVLGVLAGSDIGALVEAAVNLSESNAPVGGVVVQLGENLLSYLVVVYLRDNHPVVYWLFVIVGLIELQVPAPVGPNPPAQVDPGNPRLAFENLGALFTDPIEFWRTLYFSNGLQTRADARAAAERLFRPIAALMNALGLRAHFGGYPSAGPPYDPADHMLYVGYAPGNGAAFGSAFALSSAEDDDLGLICRQFGTFAVQEDVGSWRIAVSAAASVGILAIGRNGVQFPPMQGTPSVEVELAVTKLADPITGHPPILIGSTTGTRFEIGEFEVAGSLALGDENPDAGVSVAARSAAIVIKGGDGDGFLAKVLPEEGLRVGFSIRVGFSTQRGIFFEGGVDEGTAIVLKIPIRQTLFGVINFEDVRLHLGPLTGPPAGIRAALGGTIVTNLGPLVATIEDMGLELRLRFEEGNLGPVALDFGFKPPSGVGLVIDAKAVKGGGYLFISEHRYAGILQLEILEKISVVAIAIITTELPGGVPGFSLFVLISVEFDPGIQLGMGFALVGVGGLFGLNRTMNPEALRAGVRAGTLSNILFPVDPVAHAAEVIASIESFFPVEKDRFVFGPMFKIGWGTPTLVSLELGLVIEVPEPVRIAIPGVLRMILPTPESPVVALNVSFLGLVDFGRKFISIDASLFDSKILTFTLEGDMAFRLYWGDQPLFIYSMGGFHPAFQIPSGLGLEGMRRLSLCIIDTSMLRLAFQAYMAVTSNTVQFGAQIELWASIGIATLEGRGGFDAIFYFNPFALDIALFVLVALKIGNTDILAIAFDAHLTGPRPWHVWGSISVKVLGLEIHGSIDETFGEIDHGVVQTIAVEPLLVEALEQIGNWSSSMSDTRRERVSVRSMLELPAADRLVVHPGGRLQIDQAVVPLDTSLDVFGNQPIDGPSKFSITRVEVVGPGGVATNLGTLEPLSTGFAIAQYREMSAAEKLRAPSFTQMPSGVRVGTSIGTLAMGTPRVVQIQHETWLIDRPGTPAVVPPVAVVAPIHERAGVDSLGLAATGTTIRVRTRAPMLEEVR